MANNKVQLADGTVLIDLTGDNVQPGNVEEGITFHDASGTQRSGTLPRTVSADNVFFSDGETFQAKYDSGELIGPQGPKGETGAAGYTPARGTDYWTAADQNAIVSQAVTQINTATKLATLPSSGTVLTANAEYRVAAAVDTYQFAFPASGDVYVRFTTAANFAISFASGTTYLGAVPTFEAGKTYELMARDGCVAAAEVASE